MFIIYVIIIYYYYTLIIIIIGEKKCLLTSLPYQFSYESKVNEEAINIVQKRVPRKFMLRFHTILTEAAYILIDIADKNYIGKACDST